MRQTTPADRPRVIQFPVKASRMVGAAGVVLAAAFLHGVPWGAVFSAAQAQGRPPTIMRATRTDTSAPLRDLPVRPPRPAVLGAIFERPFKLLPNRQDSFEADVFDGALQGPVSPAGAPTVLGSIDGIGNRNGVLPPDPTGAIGPNHYVQMVNLSFAVYARDPGDPQQLLEPALYGPADSNTVWTGFGGPCEITNHGDPIVLYDHLADRWLYSQFALPNFPSGPFYVCIAVSQTPDPTGAYHRYAYAYSQSILNDYPKFSVWPDGYYMSTNEFFCSFFGCSWWGQGVAAFERDLMLVGDSQARGIAFDLGVVDPNLGGMLPADLDGPPPPLEMPVPPAPFMQIDDDAWGYSPDQLQLWEFDVDWGNLLNSTFTHVADIPTASFNSNMCQYARNCIRQPSGGTRVDAISDRLMFRLQYRDFGNYRTLVTNHTVDVNGRDHAGVRWYELRDDGGGWVIYQQGTYAPDRDHRWMGSIAMNQIGDIALGYSLSSRRTYPSVAVTGRLNGDSAGAMTQQEVMLAAGTGVQTHSSGRWGDYSHMTVDPLDDCTFWYTQEYYAETGPAPWRTAIGSVKLRDCGALPEDTENPTVSMTSPVGGTVSGTVSVVANATDNVGVTRVDFYVGAVLSGSDGTSPYQWDWDTTMVANVDYNLSAKAYDAAGNEGVSPTVTVTVFNEEPPPPPPGGVVTVTDIDPSSVSVGITRDFVITGTGFSIEPNVVVEVAFENGSGPSPRVNSVAVDSSTRITATVEIRTGGPPRPRVWDVRVTNPDASTGVGVGLLTINP